MDIILLIIICFYLLLHFIYYAGLRKSLRLDTLIHDEFPTVTVIVAAKNEELNIASSIKSLLNIDYPADKLEIILVNDNSEDSTLSIMQEMTKGISKFKILTTGDYTKGGTRG